MKTELTCLNCYAIVNRIYSMVAFARAKTKSIFSKLRFTAISKKQIETNKSVKKEDLSIKKEKNSNYFLDNIRALILSKK